VGVCIGVLGVGVGGEEFNLGDTVQHRGCQRLMPVVSPMGARGEGKEVLFGRD